MKKNFVLITSMIAMSLSSIASAEMMKVDVGVGGFIRFDYGSGDRYEIDGDDHIGISKVALALTAKRDNVEAVFVVGAQPISDTSGSGDVDTKDAFLIIHDAAPGLDFSLGAQPLLFGLKPNGYPSDRSIIGSVEYGAGGAAAVSQQAETSAIAQYGTDMLQIRAGVFERSGDVAATDNLFAQLRLMNVGLQGSYAVLGYETLDGDDVLTVGLGMKAGIFDASLEAFMFDQEAVTKLGGDAVGDDETYVVAEFTVKPIQDLSIYVDLSNADEADIDAVRVGAIFMGSNGLEYRAEISSDDIGGTTQESVDLRVGFNF